MTPPSTRENNIASEPPKNPRRLRIVEPADAKIAPRIENIMRGVAPATGTAPKGT